METTMISWNVPNIVSVWLMAAMGFLIVGIAAQLLLNMGGGSGTDQSPSAGGY